MKTRLIRVDKETQLYSIQEKIGKRWFDVIPFYAKDIDVALDKFAEYNSRTEEVIAEGTRS